ncbi:MAG TPA: acetyltransferase [Cyanobacteria bacterium UBA11162]|nr:acetyltransferase [Cyanobacteria bacterium UBA12227]HAX84694.1 acetyltransferase [Cyanobacteria bacterium UBA11370]HBL12259.1 acetyltransferase [Cyanobacteria bacterium UBA11162]HBY77924.1 acetyltransferase [Cyanobacteria bacterium UBA11148]
MLLTEKQSGELVEILEIEDLLNPNQDTITGQIQGGQSEQPPDSFEKKDLVFPSGEGLPRCWLDPNYRLESAPQ